MNLFTTPWFTEASTKAAVELTEWKVLALRRLKKGIVKRENSTQLIEQTGVDAVKAGCRLNWGMPGKPEVVMTDLLRASELGLIRVDEFRGMMKKSGWDLTEPEENEEM